MSSSAEASSIAMAAGSVRDSNFYLGFAIVSAVMVFTGFSRSFYLKPYFNTPRLPLLFQVHGSVFTLWVLFFVAQAWLAWDGRFNLHRQMGTAGAVLAGLAVILGVAIAFVSSGMGHFNKIPGAGDPAEACLFSLFDIALFAVFVWAGFLWRSNPEVHSRLMVLSMAVPLLPSAIGRMCNFKPGIATPIIFAFMLAGPIYDLITRRKIHPAYLVGLVVIVVTGPPLRLALGKTALWHHLFASAVARAGSRPTLGTQIHVHVEVHIGAAAPELVAQRFTRHDLAGVAQESEQNLERLFAQPHLDTILPETFRLSIDKELPEVQAHTTPLCSV